MSRRIIFAALLVLQALIASPAMAEPKAVVELFTSQGCSASLKADHLTAELAARGDVVLLTLPVDYWDYLGWKDPFASAGNSARQRAYARARSDRKVFTPQIVVNGVAPAIPNNRASILAALESSATKENTLSVPVRTAEAAGQIEVVVGAGTAGHEAEVWLFALSRSKTVAITAGQNQNHSMTYINVVRRMTRLGAWTGREVHFTLPRTEAMPQDSDRYVVLVQSGSGSMPGPILGVTGN